MLMLDTASADLSVWVWVLLIASLAEVDLRLVDITDLVVVVIGRPLVAVDVDVAVDTRLRLRHVAG